MFKKTIFSTLMLLAFSTHMTAQAQVVDGVDDKTVQTLKQNFEQKTKIPASKIDYIGKSAFPGIFVVVSNGYSLPVFSDITFNKMFVGNYIDNERNQIDLINEIKDKNYKISTSKLNIKNAVVDVYGKGTRKLYVFADANCGFCKKLETEVLSKLTDATVYTFPISILRPGGDADKKVRTLLCSKPESEQGKKFVDVMVNSGGTMGDESCEKAKSLATNTQLSRDLGISGTPTLIFETGAVHVGFIELSPLEEKLKSFSGKK